VRSVGCPVIAAPFLNETVSFTLDSDSVALLLSKRHRFLYGLGHMRAPSVGPPRSGEPGAPVAVVGRLQEEPWQGLCDPREPISVVAK
jgi:hypothetical protein